ncbi:hypothetical protein QTP70_002316 [Hemibagrus guttatus]|uniref:ribonuclease H n=1 Tax=Hemibagrus guttatus TaxID=175788 RepID=A0AAE0VB98_9TELE|nr:hypothetical protein QTP70_002316 [Hemibagrus guttatus]
MGKFGVKERTLEGQMVVDFAKRMDMAVVNTYFQKREEHYTYKTYKSGGRSTQVDYILCRRGNLKEISDCKVAVGESVARQHRMVVCRMTLMVCKKKRSKIEKKTKWWKLKKEECCEEFRQKLRQALGGQVVLPDDWETTAVVIRETGRKVLGVSSGRRKEDKETWWWNEEVQDSVQRKRLAKKKWDMDRTEENRQEYKELQHRVKREVSKAKQKAYDELYTRLDTREGEKDLYRLARQRDRDGKDVHQVRVIKDSDGRVLTSEESVQRRWKEYFEELMNEENEREKRVEGVNSVEQKVDKIRKDEVRKALKRMKSGKAVGPDDIPVEVWKCLGEAAVEFLTSLFNRVLESERMPEEWRNLEKAYDRVPREELWYCMRKSGVAEKYVRVVQDMYERSRTVVRCAVGQTEEFKVEVGLHQGSALSPFLFAMVMDQLSEEVRQESPWTIMFADDIVICSESREQVEENLERWRFALERRGMKVSRSKTEYMCVNEREGSGTVRLQGEEVKKVQEFKYLGSTVQSNGECGKERLLGEFPLSAEELENVFDTLDADGNGYLTPEEFSSGFSEFIFGPTAASAATVVAQQPIPEHAPEPVSHDMLYQSQWENKLSVTEDEEEKHFSILMENLGASNVFEDPRTVRNLWAQLRRDEPRLLSNFEEFLGRVTYQIKEANQEKSEMETALKRKAASHDDEIQRLYEEMEQQIKNEKDKIILQDSERFLTRSQDLEYQLSSKERELEMLSNKQKRLEQQCRELHSEQRETAVENVKLKQYNEELAHELEHTTQELSLAQEQLSLLQEQASRLHEERDMEMNKHLRDEQDMCYQKPKNSAVKASRAQGSGYTERKQSFKGDEEDILPHSKRKSAVGIKVPTLAIGQKDQVEGLRSPAHQLQRIISIEEDHLPQLLQKEYQAELRNWSEEEDLEDGIDLQMTSIFHSTSTPISQCPPADSRHAHTPTSPRGQPVGKETVQLEEGANSGPDRLFKIVLVGNSNVGKTSLLRRFCDDCFYPGTSATVGIDYSVKTLLVDNSQVALQMWDTAGQERYRSITKQFFRKADGVVVMYDITCEQTFTAVRSWLASVQEGAGDDIPVMLLGNKTDLEGQREIQFRVGEKLAMESRMIFFECSAFSGHNVTESMVNLARILKEQEDREKEKTVSLIDAPSKKKSCC